MLILLESVRRACTQDSLLNRRRLGAAPTAEVSTGARC